MGTFILDENVYIGAIALGRADYQGGRYVRVGDPDTRASALVAEIVTNGHGLAVSNELWGRYQTHRSMLQDAGITTTPHPSELVGQLWSTGRVDFRARPPAMPLPDTFPAKDRYLAYLAVAADAVLVTEDEGVLASAEGGRLGFEAVTIAEALASARTRA